MRIILKKEGPRMSENKFRAPLAEARRLLEMAEAFGGDAAEVDRLKDAANELWWKHQAEARSLGNAVMEEWVRRLGRVAA